MNSFDNKTPKSNYEADELMLSQENTQEKINELMNDMTLKKAFGKVKESKNENDDYIIPNGGKEKKTKVIIHLKI